MSLRSGAVAWLPAVLLAGATVGYVLLAGPARAHAELEGSQPADGATAATPLEAVTLEFDAPVTAPEITVTDPTGADVADGAAQVDGRRVIQPVGPLRHTGRYTVAYQVLSADDHPAFGEIAFTYTGPTEGEPPNGEVPTPAPGDDRGASAVGWPLLALGGAAIAVLAAGAYAVRMLTRPPSTR